MSDISGPYPIEFKDLPVDLRDRYTQSGKIPVFEWWHDNSNPHIHEWSEEYIRAFCTRFTEHNIRSNQEGASPYSNASCVWLIDAFLKYNITGKNVAVIGSESPWIEAMLLNLNNNVTTIEYNVPEGDYNLITCRNYFSYFENTHDKFDCIVTYSSVEHSGLGRYGDRLDPEGDINTMRNIHQRLNSDGLLVWGAPVWGDALVWNAHRIYGNHRLPIMFNNFTELEWIGAVKEELLTQEPGPHTYIQPVVILSPK